MVYTETVAFDPPKIISYLDKYDQVKMDGCGTITVDGHPSLPSKTISLIFDLDDDITNVTVNVSSYELNGTYLVSPAPKASINGTGDLLTEPDPTIYNGSNPYPGKWYDYDVNEGIDPTTMRRVKYLIIHLYPVQYSPVSGVLTISTEATVTVSYGMHERVASSLAPEGTLSPVYDLLIVTSPALEAYASTLAEYKNSVGISTFITTTDEVYSSYPGRDNPEKIRNYITSAVASSGITYVLIFGDADHVPVRYVYIPDGDSSDGDLVETDFYYADLQHSWDDNDDGLWGDLDYDQVDGVPDLLIGRLPVSTEFYAAAIVNKTINYESFNGPGDPWFNSMLLVGTDPFSDPGAEGELLTDYIADNIVWSNFTVTKLYRTYGNQTVSNLQSLLNSGFGFVNYAGHGDIDLWHLGADWATSPIQYSSTDALNLRNGLKLPVVITMACQTSQFADYECIGEYFMANPDGGAIAYFGASRLAWGYTGESITDGLAGEMAWRFNKAFFDGNRVSGAVWGQAITEYVQSNAIDNLYDGYYLDWKTVAEYGSPFMDPTLMIGGRARRASVVDLMAPGEVYVGMVFSVDLTVSYTFPEPTELFSGIYDVEVGAWIAEEFETFVGVGTQTYSFELTAPTEEASWALEAGVWYYSDGEWMHAEADWAESFDIQVIAELEEETYSASVVELVVSSEVYLGEVFIVDLTVSYAFPEPTELFSGIYDVEAGAWSTNEDEILVGEGTKTYSFELTAPEEETTWALEASVWYTLEDGWTHNEEEYSYAFEVSVVEDESGSIRDFALFTGWNLISLPFTPVDPSTEVVLADILDSIESVWAFDGETKAWSAYAPGAPSDLNEMVQDQGTWIKMTENATLTVYGTRAPPLEEWSKTFGGHENDDGRSVQETSDGGYIITGITESFGAGGWDVYLVKADSQGVEEWSTTFGGSGYDFGWFVQETSDGGYIITGQTSSYGTGGYDVYLVKTDSQGWEEWTNAFGGSEDDWGRSVQETSDGGYIITGQTSSFGAGGADVYLVKTNSQGAEEWSRTFGGDAGDLGYSVQETSDGGYIIAGTTDSFGAGGADVYLVKVGSQGVEEWSNAFGGSGYDDGWSVQETSDGGYIIAGSTDSFGAGGADVYLVKADSQGVEEWSRTFGGYNFDYGRSAQVTSDGGYIITGITKSFGAGGWDVYLVKTDSQGWEEWTNAFGGSENDQGRSVQETSDGGYIITGSTWSFGALMGDVYLIKTGSQGRLRAGWNLIGLPFTPVDPSIEVVLADILDNVISVWAFDGETKFWSSYSPGAPSSLTEMADDVGYWIRMNEDITWTFE